MSDVWYKRIITAEKSYIDACKDYDNVCRSLTSYDDASMEITRHAFKKMKEAREIYYDSLKYDTEKDEADKKDEVTVDDEELKKAFKCKKFFQDLNDAKEALENTYESKAYRKSMKDLNEAIDAYPRDEEDLNAKRKAKNQAWEYLIDIHEYKTYEGLKSKMWDMKDRMRFGEGDEW